MSSQETVKTKSKMFPFITKTWNPLAIRKCSFGCVYCWAEGLKQTRLKNTGRYMMLNQQNAVCAVVETPLTKPIFKAEDFVFVGTMGDMFAPDIPSEAIEQTLELMRYDMKTNYLFLTKNPGRYKEFLNTFLKFNAWLGTTCETNRDTRIYSKAPSTEQRLWALSDLEYPRKFLSIEPIMDFDLSKFFEAIGHVQYLSKIAVGYDNYNHGLPEPDLAKTKHLIEWLRGRGYEVIEKTLREKY
jgi:protein gp37